MPSSTGRDTSLGDICVNEAFRRAELERRVRDMFSADGCPMQIINHILHDTNTLELSQIANLRRINHPESLLACNRRGDVVYDGYELHIMINPENRQFIHIRTMDTVPPENTEDPQEIRTRVGWLLSNIGMRREHVGIVLNANMNMLHKISRLSRLRRMSGRRTCSIPGDFYIEYGTRSNVLNFLTNIHPEEYVRVAIPSDIEMERNRMMEAAVSRINPSTIQTYREQFEILPHDSQGTNRHDDVASSFSGEHISIPLREVPITIDQFETLVDGECNEAIKKNVLSEKDEKLIKVANIIKDSMLVELELFYNPSNDTFELSAIDESADSKVLILKGHGKDKADLLKEHFEL